MTEMTNTCCSIKGGWLIIGNIEEQLEQLAFKCDVSSICIILGILFFQYLAFVSFKKFGALTSYSPDYRYIEPTITHRIIAACTFGLVGAGIGTLVGWGWQALGPG